jgi:hypothetical protein
VVGQASIRENSIMWARSDRPVLGDLGMAQTVAFRGRSESADVAVSGFFFAGGVVHIG